MDGEAGRSLRCKTLDDIGALITDRDALARVAEMPGAASGIVQHPDWLRAELEARGRMASPQVVVANDAQGRIVGYAPFLLEHRTAHVAFGKYPVPIYRGSALRMLGSRVVAAPHQHAAVERAIASTIKRDNAIRIIRIQETLLPNTFAGALSNGQHRFTSTTVNLLEQINWTIEPQLSLETYLAGFGSKSRNDLTRRLRKVYKKLGETACLRTFEAPEEIDEYCRLMNRVYARSWHACAQPIDWELPARRNLLCRFARDNHFVGHLLMLGDRPVAYVHGYRLSGHYVLDDTGYDDEFASLGIGSSLVFQAVQDLIERHPGERIDFGYGDNQYKRVLANRQTSCGALYLVRGFGPRVCFLSVGPLRLAYRGMRTLHDRLQQRVRL